MGVVAEVEFIEEFLYEGEAGEDYLYIYRAFHNGPFAPDLAEVERVEFFSPKQIGQMLLSEPFHPEFKPLWERLIHIR